jgi:hypothetical protein
MKGTCTAFQKGLKLQTYHEKHKLLDNYEITEDNSIKNASLETNPKPRKENSDSLAKPNLKYHRQLKKNEVKNLFLGAVGPVPSCGNFALSVR